MQPSDDAPHRMFGSRDSDGAYLSLDHPHILGNRFNTDAILLLLRQNITSFLDLTNETC